MTAASFESVDNPFHNYRSGSIICEVEANVNVNDIPSTESSSASAVQLIINDNIRKNKAKLTTSKGDIDGTEAEINIQSATGKAYTQI